MAHTAQIKFVEEVKKMFPQFFEHKRVLDVGSLDINGSNRIHFRKCDYTGIDLGNGRGVDVVCRAHEWNADPYDVVISTECLEHDEWWEKSLPNMIRLLKPGGIFLFNIEHPVFTAGVGQDWIYTDDGKPQYWAIDNYFITGERNTHFLGCDVVKQHHTLTQIIMGLLNNGFELKVVEEAEPPKEMMDIPGMEDELRRPMMLLVKAIAKK